MPISSHPVSRRMTLAVAPLLLAAGCRWGPAEETSSEPVPNTPETLPDADQVDAAVAAITEAHDFVSAVSSKHDGLAAPMAALASMHTAHLELLDPDHDSGASRTHVPPGSGAALAAVRRREATLQTTLSGLAADVTSGTLARTLAAMAAGVAQHRQVLRDPKKGSDA